MALNGGDSWYYANVTSSSSYVPMTITSGSTSLGTVWTEAAPPRKPTALEWLDAEVERTCALARVA